MKAFLHSIILISLSFIQMACNSGANNDNTPGITSAVGKVNIRTLVETINNKICISINNSNSTLNPWWSQGQFELINNCSSNQSINNLSILISSKNYDLDTRQIALNSINGLYFGPPQWWAQPILNFTTIRENGVNAIKATINTADNIPAYIKPGETALVSFSYKPEGKPPGTFNYDIKLEESLSLLATIRLNIDARSLKTICANMKCNIPIILSSQNGTIQKIVSTINYINAGTQFQVPLNGLLPGNYALLVNNDNLPKEVSFSSVPVNLPSGATIIQNAFFQIEVNNGSTTFTINKPDGVIPADNFVTVELINIDNGILVASQKSNFDTSYQFSNLPTGNYRLQTAGLADVKSGVYYAPIQKDIAVKAGTPLNLGKISFSKLTRLVPVTLNLSGLEPDEIISIIINDDFDYNFNKLNLGNGKTSLKFPDKDKVIFNFLRNSKYLAINPFPANISNGLVINISPKHNPEYIHRVDFDNDQPGLYNKEDFQKDWKMNPNQSSGQGSRLRIIIEKNNNQVLGVTYKANQTGGQSAMTFTPAIEGKYTHLFFQYKVKFAAGFNWVKGGKLPGLTSSPDSPTGCIDNNSFDGFSTRLMWRENGSLYSYIYNPDKIERCGDYYSFSPPISLNKNQWYTVTQEVQLNHYQKNDGFIRQWIDNDLVLSISNIKLRTANSIYIDQIKMDTFFGGSSQDWAPLTDQYAYFDDFMISESMPELD